MNYLKITALFIAISGNLAAQDVSIHGSRSHTIKIPVPNTTNTTNTRLFAPVRTKEIKLLNVTLSEKAQKVLADKANQALTQQHKRSNNGLNQSGKLPTIIQLQMNGVPVLDQGAHGTCVTFAVTAALDALIGKGDYVSQLCQLQLGNYLDINGYAPSGWDGSYARNVLSQVESTGIVSKEQQKLVGCGGLIEYPLNEEDPATSISIEDYHGISEPLDESLVHWWPILDVYNAINDRIDTNKTLFDVKTSLKNGDRVTFAVLLLDFDMGVMGAVGKKGPTYDSWVLTPEIARDVYLKPDFGGHEMIITGYDDNAVAIDDNGYEHKGLLTLRNSWGPFVGDRGNFYMSYDYFKLLVIDAQRIHKVEYDDMDDAKKY